MKVVWKCDYCNTNHQDKNIINKHEKECNYNPKNKHCYSCIHFKVSPFGEECSPKPLSEMYGNMIGIIECDQWENKL